MNDILKSALNRHSKQRPAPQTAYVPAADVVDRFRGKWKEHVAAARSAWVLLGEKELVKSEGRRANLAWLLQMRYTMSSPDANHQIDSFMHKCGC